MTWSHVPGALAKNLEGQREKIASSCIDSAQVRINKWATGQRKINSATLGIRDVRIKNATAFYHIPMGRANMKRADSFHVLARISTRALIDVGKNMK